MVFQFCAISSSTLISCAQRLPLILLGELPNWRLKLSPRLCAASVLMTNVLWPSSAARVAVAAAIVVLPTPPLPVKSITLILGSI
jgi:hypothetical protein